MACLLPVFCFLQIAQTPVICFLCKNNCNLFFAKTTVIRFLQKTIVICFLQKANHSQQACKKTIGSISNSNKKRKDTQLRPQKRGEDTYLRQKKTSKKKHTKKKHTRKNLQESVELSTGNTCKGHHLCRRLLFSLLGASLVLSSGLDRKGFRV